MNPSCLSIRRQKLIYQELVLPAMKQALSLLTIYQDRLEVHLQQGGLRGKQRIAYIEKALSDIQEKESEKEYVFKYIPSSVFTLIQQVNTTYFFYQPTLEGVRERIQQEALLEIIPSLTKALYIFSRLEYLKEKLSQEEVSHSTSSRESVLGNTPSTAKESIAELGSKEESIQIILQELRKLLSSTLDQSQVKKLVEQTLKTGLNNSDARLTLKKGAKNWLTVKQVAKYLEYSPSYVYELVSNQAIPFYRQGQKGHPRFSQEEINEWLKEGRQSSKEQISNRAADFLTTRKKASK